MTTPDEKTFATLTKLFEEEFGPIGDRQVLYVHAPGRSEISGNHTDGKRAVLALRQRQRPVTYHACSQRVGRIGLAHGDYLICNGFGSR